MGAERHSLLTGWGGVRSVEPRSPQRERSRTRMLGQERASSHGWESDTALLASALFKVMVRYIAEGIFILFIVGF